MQASMRDMVLVGALVGFFATLTTVHVAILFGLVARAKRWRAAAALLLPVLAPVFAFAERMRIRGALWCTAAVLYTVALALSLK